MKQYDAYSSHKKSIEPIRRIRKKIKTLQKEKAVLLAEIEGLREKGEAKARKLENEVIVLRKEVETLERVLEVKVKDPPK